MKLLPAKAVALIALFLIAPFLSKAQQFPPEKIFSTPIDSLILIAIGGVALYGLVKMWNSKQPAR